MSPHYSVPLSHHRKCDSNVRTKEMIFEKSENVPALEELASLLAKYSGHHSNSAHQGAGMVFEVVSLLSCGNLPDASQKWSNFERLFSDAIPWSDGLCEMYNNVSNLLKKENVRCPQCGGILMTAKAKQCLHCNADWHEKETF